MVLRGVTVGLVVLAACACGGPEDADGPSASRSRTAGSSSTSQTADLWLTFDDAASGTYPDALGRGHTGVLVVSNAGTVEPVAGPAGRGQAVAFPVRCSADTGCPRALVEVAYDPSLDPGDGPFAFGASVRLAPDQTTTGSNIVQQGRFGTTGGQWKLQVDSEAGEPSCVVRSSTGAAVVRSSVSIADDEWHRVECRRDADGVTIEVDGTVDRTSARTGEVGSSWPIRIGSPGVGDHDDQFHGAIDDVFLEIESRS